MKPADKDEPGRLVRAKSNIGPDSGGFAYTLFGGLVPGYEFTAQRVDWGAPLEGSARELMAVEDHDDGGEAIEDAEAFLLDTLKDGPVPTRDIQQAARAHGHAWRTVNRAKKQLGIKASKGGLVAGWSWELPAPKNANHGGEGCQLR